MPQRVKAHSEKQQWVTYTSLADAKPASCSTGNVIHRIKYRALYHLKSQLKKLSVVITLAWVLIVI